MTRPGLPFFAVVLLATHSAFAGIAYDFRSISSGMTDTTFVGRAEADGKNFRVDVSTGDGRLFKDKSVILSNDGGKTIRVVDRAAKSYYDLEIGQMTKGPASLFGAEGLVKVSALNPNVTVRDEGSGGTIAGFPTRKTAIDSSCDLIVDAGGQKFSMHIKMRTENWTTDRIPAEYTNFLMVNGMRQGVEALDKLMEARGANHLNGFALKQVVVLTISQNGSDAESTTTSTVSGIVTKSVPVTDFQLPAGLTKTDDPIKAMMKQIGVQ
jgi:hypothetical protein